MSSTIDPGMSIPELINIVKQSFRESEFDEVQHILMDRVEKLKNENENLRRDHESAKKDARLLEEKLRISRKKCNELNDTISSLETRVGEMEKEREELKRQNVEAAKSLENLQTDHESRKKVARLLDKSQKLADLEKLRRSRQKCKELNDRISSFETRFGKMEKVEKEMEELKRQNDELRREKIESDEKAERYKIRIDNLEPRIIRMEGALADMLNVKVEDLAPLANSIDKSDDDGAARGENVDMESDKVSQGLGNKNAIETEPQRCHRTDGKGWQCKQGALPDQKYCESHYRRGRAKKLVLNTQSVNNFLPHLDKGDCSTKDNGANTSQTSPASQSGGSPRVEPQFPGDKNLVHSSTKDDGTNTAQISPGSQSGGSPSLEPVKVTGVQAGDIIEIVDTDDETNSNDKFVSDTYLTKRNKRSRICLSDEEDDNIPVDGKENQDPESTHDSITPLNGVRCGDSQTHDICTDSDDDSSCSDGHMNNLVATIRSKKMGTT